MSRSSQLFELQLIDLRLDQNKKRLLEINKILSDDTDISSANKQLKEANEELKISFKSLREAEIKVQDQRHKIKQTETKLYGGKIKNPKELQDLQNESNSLKRYLSVLEDRQLELMLEVDEKKDLVSSAKTILDRTLEISTNIHTNLSSEKIQINNENEELIHKRRSKLSLIPQEDADIYERLRKQRFGVAVSEVIDHACSACGATLTAALAQSARSPSQITFCENCGRILCAN